MSRRIQYMGDGFYLHLLTKEEKQAARDFGFVIYNGEWFGPIADIRIADRYNDMVQRRASQIRSYKRRPDPLPDVPQEWFDGLTLPVCIACNSVCALDAVTARQVLGSHKWGPKWDGHELKCVEVLIAKQGYVCGTCQRRFRETPDFTLIAERKEPQE